MSLSNGISLESRILLSRIALICIATILIILVIRRKRQTQHIIKEFFTATTNPINLAVFRIVIFGTIFSFDMSETVMFSQFPAELIVPPRGLEWLLNYLPINETLATISGTLFRGFAFTAMIGLFSRTSALLTAVIGFYALGIPQFFGKVDHNHHLLWFSAILAASRCGDYFSWDAIFAAWKRAARGIVEPPSSSSIYALPLRFVWLLLGIIYFFPGFWKFWTGGIDWTESFKYHLYAKWQSLNWIPFFRIDQYAFLYQPSALLAIVFEISFIILIFFPRWRIWAAIAGLMFHQGIDIFMRISFWTLEIAYVTFFDWYIIFHRLGRWLYRQKMYVVYDGNCKLCRQTIASLRMFDIFGRVTYVNALNREALAEHGLLWLDSTAILADMHAVSQKKTWIGFSAYRAIASYIPILWPVLPFLYVWPIPKLGKRIYRYVADRRTCSIAEVPLLEAENYPENPQSSLRTVTTIGVFLALVNSLFGTQEATTSWPFACYPTFANNIGVKARVTRVVALSSTGETISLNEDAVKQKFSTGRYMGLMRHTLKVEKNPEKLRSRLQAIWLLLVQQDPNLQRAVSVRFYKDTLSTIPERQRENPLKRELLYELKL
ncbi:DCC1-like thiol-disulfide oxidoreductase family protein [Coleofasciculus sp. FACHB-1120]|uniref:DCC1-like thiol-disulfide oxidoreductase family protein n=1 Tax=Coleofasciculus sp. FACHB-1120 TaxID=2692783 RepID=UPI00168670FE|nr:DCC1-like thiol-disulfide oxidoreductase family protein [Coleofasciculus sp. FACHB-1120]MBD2740341.1 DUF393 domain-containing protein [Coleofasciculus sp. FACHB-1120]